MVQSAHPHPGRRLAAILAVGAAWVAGSWVVRGNASGGAPDAGGTNAVAEQALPFAASALSAAGPVLTIRSSGALANGTEAWQASVLTLDPLAARRVDARLAAQGTTTVTWRGHLWWISGTPMVRIVGGSPGIVDYEVVRAVGRPVCSTRCIEHLTAACSDAVSVPCPGLESLFPSATADYTMVRSSRHTGRGLLRGCASTAGSAVEQGFPRGAAVESMRRCATKLE